MASAGARDPSGHTSKVDPAAIAAPEFPAPVAAALDVHQLRYGLERLAEIVGSQGAQLHHEGDVLRVCLSDREFVFNTAEVYVVGYELRDLHGFKQRVFFESHEGRLVADCRGPQRCRMPWTGDHIWLPGIPEGADFIAGYLQRHRPRAGDLVFDVGAFCGETALVLARLVGERGRVIAFEPAEGNRRYLERNLAAAGVGNVTIVPAALSNHAGEHALSTAIGPGVRLVDEALSGGVAKTPVRTLAEACTLAGGVPTFIKMDIEGAELEVIESSLEFIRTHAIAFAIASYHRRDGVATARALEVLFRRIGYEVDTGYALHLTTWAAPRLPAAGVALDQLGPRAPTRTAG